MVQPSSGDTRLRAAVIGTGGISKEHLGFLASSPRAELVGVCDLSPVAVAHAATTYATRPFSSVDEMITATRPEIIHVLTPPNTHLAIATTALRAGAHVVCEKPITLGAEDLEQLLSVARECDRHIVENHNYRFNPEIELLDGLLAAGSLGTVAEVEIRIGLPVTDPAGRFGDPNLTSPIHDLPAGVIHDFITHMVYLLAHFTPGVDWSTVDSQWNNHAGVAHFPVDDLDATLVGVGPDGAVHGRLRFSALMAPDCFEITVRGTEGYGQVELFSGRVSEVIPRPVGKQLAPIANMMIGGLALFAAGPRSLKRKIMQEGPYVGLAKFLDLTYEALGRGEAPPVTPDDMLTTSRLIDRLVAGRSPQIGAS